MAKELDPTFENSTGIFADPVTKAPLTIDTERTQTCPDATTFKYPKIKASDGKEYRLASKLWNRTEKDAYNAYKAGTDTNSGETKSKPSKSVDTEKLDKLDEFLKTALKGDDLEKALTLTKALRPEDPAITKAKKQVANMTPEQKALFMQLLSA